MLCMCVHLVVLVLSRVVLAEPLCQRFVLEGSSDAILHLDLPQSVGGRNQLHHSYTMQTHNISSVCWTIITAMSAGESWSSSWFIIKTVTAYFFHIDISEVCVLMLEKITNLFSWCGQNLLNMFVWGYGQRLAKAKYNLTTLCNPLQYRR